MQGNIIHPDHVNFAEMGILRRHQDGDKVASNMDRRLHVRGDDP